jgi:hypothetical protein
MIERTDNPNLAILEIAVEALGNLSDSLVFVGGCATGLLVTRVRVNQIRATKDVDVVTRVATIAEYHASRNFSTPLRDISQGTPRAKLVYRLSSHSFQN